ncbi:MAG: succinate dehydrogenase assembly factor 2 [Rhizobiales bacterium]|nr:succinate dehydrogenase assembly factor 2 [Hyphomicrobiales bacterium]MBI3673767.1 succinate dehydrogenase assembly factor 2 [Hyphomicrobiales bacterium]
MTEAAEDIETRRKRLLWRASHRGIKEMDLILGGFARAHIGGLDAARLDQLEAIIAIPDQELLSWATKLVTVPADHASPLLLEILDRRP